MRNTLATMTAIATAVPTIAERFILNTSVFEAQILCVSP
jgi:hypothetical protein